MADDAASLYRQWWDALPAMFAAMRPAPAAVPEGDAPPADWLAFLKQAPGLADTLLTQLYGAWLPLLQSGGSLTEPLRALGSQFEASLDRLRTSQTAAPFAAWPAPLLLAAGVAGAASPWQAGADRAFGALGDALGLRAMRELQEAWQALAATEVERRAAQADYLALLGKTWRDGIGRLTDRLDEMGKRGEKVTSFLDFVRLWAHEADVALHAALQSEAGLEATAKSVRASTKRRAELQRLVELASRAFNVPTRAELDDAYREIHELKRELRRLKQAAPRAEPAPAQKQAAIDGRARSRAVPAKRSTRNTGARP